MGNEASTEQTALPGFSHDVAAWLMDAALSEDSVESIIAGTCARLHALGLPLLRGHVSFRTLHPLFHAIGLTWDRNGGLSREEYPHRSAEEMRSLMQNSPFGLMFDSGVDALRRRLTGPTALLDYPVLHTFREAGGTDYSAFAVAFDEEGEHGVIGSWIIDRPNGFTDAELAGLKLVEKHIAVVCKMRVEAEIAHNVATTYLGGRSGQRVLSGRIKRGDAEPVNGAIWYSDLRRSTELSKTLEPLRFLEKLNIYFEATAGSVMEAGGEVLLLIGDAVLAIFQEEAGTDSNASCARALEAARNAGERLDREMADNVPISFGVGLHVGGFLLGNIGVPQRLEFTAIGPAINEVARLESLTKETGRRIVASRAFVDRQPADWQALGQHTLRGFGAPVDVFGLQ